MSNDDSTPPDSSPVETTPADRTAQDAPFRDAEAWLAEQGVPRERIRVSPRPADAPAGDAAGRGAATAPPDTPPMPPPPGGAQPAPGPPPSAREARQLAEASARDAHLRPDAAPTDAAHGPGDEASGDEAPAGRRADLGDEVSKAVAFIRRSTSSTPQSTGRLRDKLEGRGTSAVAIRMALEQAEQQGLVDDEAMCAALVEERRRKGHAPSRIRMDLRDRGFEDDLIEPLLAPIEGQDLEAQAFDVAAKKAKTLSSVEDEKAFRRVVGYVARRGYPEGLARKVAREAVFADREGRRSAER